MLMVPVQVLSSSLPVMAAPGKQLATRSGSMRNFHTACGSAWTTNFFTISKAMARALSGCEEPVGEGEELLLAAGVAEEVIAALVLAAMFGGRHVHRHATDGVDGGLRLGRFGFRRCFRRLPQLDDLREDAQRHFFRPPRADVEPRRVVHLIERLGREPARGHRLAQL